MNEPNKSKNQKEWMHHLEWRIEAEKSFLTWSGISIWILVGVIGIMGKQIIDLISEHGLDSLLVYEMYGLLMIAGLISLFMYNQIDLKNEAKFQPNRHRLFSASLFAFVLLLFVGSLYTMLFTKDINFLIIISFITMVILTLKKTFKGLVRTIFAQYPFIYKVLINLRLFNYGTLKFFNFVLSCVVFTCSAIWVSAIDFNNYSLLLGSSIMKTSIYLYAIVICILFVIRLLIVSSSIRKMIYYRDMLFLNKIDCTEIEEYIIRHFYGDSVQQYLETKSDKIKTKIELNSEKEKSVEELSKQYSSKKSITTSEKLNFLENLKQLSVDYYNLSCELLSVMDSMIILHYEHNDKKLYNNALEKIKYVCGEIHDAKINTLALSNDILDIEKDRSKECQTSNS